MTTSELNNYIFHYLKKDKTQTAIMLTGEWGSGKTYYIEKDLVPFLKENKTTAVVVSLYGLDDISIRNCLKCTRERLRQEDTTY